MEPPPLPRVNLAASAVLISQIVDEAAYPYFNDLMEGDTYLGFADAVAAVLKKKGVKPEVARKSCMPVMGGELTRTRLVEFATRVTGNLDLLKAGKPVGPFNGFTEPTWIPFRVLAALEARDRHGNYGCEFTLRAFAGAYCPGTLAKFWKPKVTSFLAREVGFSPRRSGPMGFQHPYQFVGLRFFGLAEPALARDGKPGFHKVACGTTLYKHNRGILRRRFRTDPEHLCPFGYNGAHFVACHRCGMGYRGVDGDTGCKAAVHPEVYESGMCNDCGEPEAIFDSTVSDVSCLACTVRKRTSRKG